MKTKSGKNLSQIGIGSYGIGGLGHRDMQLTNKKDDSLYINALIYTLNKDINFTEISLGYGHGQALKLFKQALDKSGVPREDVFITDSLYPRDLTNMTVLKQDIRDFYDVMETDYADSTLVTQDLIIHFGKKKVFALLEKMLSEGRTRYVSLSNASPTWINMYKGYFGDAFFAHEGHLSFEIRAAQDKKVFDTCDMLGVKNIIWRPLRQGRTFKQNWPLLEELASKYEKTQGQIILNWICSLGYSPMIMSSSKSHIDENLSSLDFSMSNEEYKRMSDFRPPNYQALAADIDWEGTKGGDDMVILANDFEKISGRDFGGTLNERINTTA
ncbi:MAG TPA: aldo/keto reductase [Candidatus Saccharimonadales bacterium]|nr:aldo/keto reductase [Candidatus Saccharimonadales bacterium]